MLNSDANITQLEELIAELRLQKAPSTQLIDALNELAQALSAVDIQRALEASKEAHALAYLLRHHMGLAASLARLSWLHLEAGAFDKAVIEAHQAQFMAEQLHDYVLTTRAIYVLAVAQRIAGNYAKAETHWRHLLSLAQSNNDAARQANFLNSLGCLFEDQRDFARALDHYRQAHGIFVQLNDTWHILAKNNMAYVMTRRGQHDEAQELAQQALHLCDPGWQVWRALFLHTLGVVHMHMEEYDSARSELGESLSLSLSPAGRKTTAVEALIDIARLELSNKRVPAAYDALEQAVNLAAEIKALPLEAQAHKMLVRLHANARDQDGADRHHDAYLTIQNKIELKRIERHVGLMRAEAKVAQLRPVWLQESRQLAHVPLDPYPTF